MKIVTDPMLELLTPPREINRGGRWLFAPDQYVSTIIFYVFSNLKVGLFI